MEHCRLINENILYLSRTLQYCEDICVKESCSLKDVDDCNKLIVKKLDYAIKICLHCNSSADNETVLYDIFYYLITKHYGQSYSVLSPICSFNVIHYLIVSTRFKGFVKIVVNLDESIQSEIFRNFIGYLETSRLLSSDSFYCCVQTLIATFDKKYSNSSSIQKLQTDLKNIVYKTKVCNLCITDYLNEIFDTMTQFQYQINQSACLRDDLFEKEFLNDSSRFVNALELLSFLTNGFIIDLDELKTLKLTNLNSILYLLSFFVDKQESLCFISNLDLLISFLKQYIKMNFEIEFNIYFIIRHRLFNYMNLIYTNILNEDLIVHQKDKKYSYTIDDVIMLENEIDQLKRPNNVYLISRILKMNNKINNKILKLRLKNLFWNLFNSLELGFRIESIKLIYENLEPDDDSNWNKNIIQDNFNQESVVLINQLSANNVDSIEVSGLLKAGNYFRLTFLLLQNRYSREFRC